MVKYCFMLYSAISSINLYDVPFNISKIRISKVYFRVPTAKKFILVQIAGLNKQICITNLTAQYYVLALPMNNTANYSLMYSNNDPASNDGTYSPAVGLSQLDITILCDDGNQGTTTLNEIQPDNNMFLEIELE